MVLTPTAPAGPAQTPRVPAVFPAAQRLLTRAEFQGLAELPSEAEWFANIQNPNTRRAYRNDLAGFMTFVGGKSAIISLTLANVFIGTFLAMVSLALRREVPSKISTALRGRVGRLRICISA